MSKLIPFLASSTGMPESDIRTIIMRAPVSYKHYFIEKRTGGKRPISQPAREVKILQRLAARALGKLPVHDAAMAYRGGRSIRDNAFAHINSGPILKMDFSSFFHSIKSDDWVRYCKRIPVFTVPEDIHLSSRLFFHRPPRSSILRLAIGAPSSPWLSNVLMYEFDERLTDELAAHNVNYTRYADDLTFSAQRTGFLNEVDRIVRKIIREMKSPSLSINEDKTVVATKKYRRVVTGLVLANDGRVTIGRDRKRTIRAAIHTALKGEGTSEANARLAGLLAYVNDVEPTYFARLLNAYGHDLLKRLQSG